MSSHKKGKSELSYFLDHPQIKRHESPGNGSKPNTGLRKWLNEEWVNTEGKRCGSKDTKNKNSPCKPKSKMNSLSKGEKAAMSKKNAKATSKGKQFASYKGTKAEGK